MNAVINIATVNNNNVFKEIEFQPEYHNGTGYFDPLADEFLGLDNYHTVDEYGRHVLIIPLWSKRFNDFDKEETIFYGNLVIFQRYASKELIAINTPRKWSTDRDHRNAIVDSAIKAVNEGHQEFHSSGMAALSMYVISTHFTKGVRVE